MKLSTDSLFKNEFDLFSDDNDDSLNNTNEDNPNNDNNLLPIMESSPSKPNVTGFFDQSIIDQAYQQLSRLEGFEL